jgi:hypothetical protein
MALKPVLDSLEGVPEALHAEYHQRDGKYHLTVEGMVSKDRLSEFRENNVTLKRQLDELSSRFDGIDPEKYRELSDRAQRDRDKKLIDAGKMEELVAERVSAMKDGYEKQIASFSEREKTVTKQLEGLLIDTAIRDAAAKSGVRPTAIEDVLLRGRTLFQLQDGKAVPMADGKPVYGKSGDPMQINEWVSGLTDQAPHLFESSQGGGSRGSSGSSVSAGRIDRSDGKAFLANLDGIASGKIAVS